MAIYQFYEDPGHGWLKVSRKELRRLGIEDRISSFSYQNNEDVFLEEDSDMSVFMSAKETRGETVGIKHHHTNKTSKIRKYNCYTF